MNSELQDFARERLVKGLERCTDAEKHIFARMYSHENLLLPMAEIVSKMPAETLSWAMEQVSRTLAKREGGASNA